MIVTGEATLIATNRGTSKKTGRDWFSVKVHDAQSEEYATLFVSEEEFQAYSQIPTHSPVLLNLNLSLATRYFRLESIEPIETR